MLGRKDYFKEEYFKEVNIVSDIPGSALRTDTTLKNPWGLVVRDRLWVAVTISKLLRAYSFSGVTLQSVTTKGFPIALVDARGTEFDADLITVAGNGIEVYRPNINANETITVSVTLGAVYLGVAILNNHLYVANFGQGSVDIFNTSFQKVNTIVDQGLAAANYAPHNVYVHRQALYIAYTLKEGTTGIGNGYLNIYLNGNLQRLIDRSPLNAPWGMFREDDKLYVGNFGDGVINVFKLKKEDCRLTAEFCDTIRNRCRQTIVNDGLRAIVPHSENIWFAADIQDEQHGLIGMLKEEDDCQCNSY